jgi:apolipoprotein D and lipocalin family protein
MRAPLALALLTALASPAAAAAPQPARGVAIGMFSGRWYEVARIAEGKDRRCQFPTNDFSGPPGGGLSVVETCHEGSPDGPAHTFNATVRILPGADNAKIKMGFLGGLISQEYWILDHADDGESWALMATPGGRFLWVLSRRPTLDGAARAAAIARIAALGYNTDHLKASR